VDGKAYSGGELLERRLESVRTVLRNHSDIDLAVLSGDQLNSMNINTTHIGVWDKLTDLLKSFGIPHSAMMGNHDAEPYVSKFSETLIASQEDALAVQSRQAQSGAFVSRDELMAADAAQSLSRTVAKDHGNQSVSNAYVLDVLSPAGADDAGRRLLSIYHLDTGSSGIPTGLQSTQTDWVIDDIRERRADHAGHHVPPVLLYAHYAFEALHRAWEADAGQCWGHKTLSTVADPSPAESDKLLQVIAEGTEVAGVFFGHEHCNDYCCSVNSTNLCFGKHSSTGGYVCPPGDVQSDTTIDNIDVDDPTHGTGMRLVELISADGKWRVETRIALVNGSVIEQHVLAEGRYS
jgi:hypothetical protein